MKKIKFPLQEDGSIDVEAWLGKITEPSSVTHLDVLRKACVISDHACKGHTTFYGQAYFEQSLAMAEIILQLKLDYQTVAATLLSSAVQYNDLPLEKVSDTVGHDIAKLLKKRHAAQHD